MVRYVWLGLVLLACEPQAWTPPELTEETRIASLEFAGQTPFQLGQRAETFWPERFRDVPDYTMHGVELVGGLSDYHLFFKAGADERALLAIIEDEAYGSGACNCTGNFFSHPTLYSQHELNSVVDWVQRSPLRPWLAGARLDVPSSAGPDGTPADVKMELEVFESALDAMRAMLRQAGVPDDAARVVTARRFEAL